MEDESLDETVAAVNGFRDRLNPYELNSFDCAKEQLEFDGYMSHRNQQFVKWMLEKYGQRTHETPCNPRQS